METKARLHYLRIAPRKVRLVASLIRKKRVPEAKRILQFTIQKSSDPLLKLLNSAIANAKNNLQLSEDNLYIRTITVDGGPIHKRFRPRARGSAYQIKKRTSHITLVLEEIKETQEKKTTKKVAKTPVLPADKQPVMEPQDPVQDQEKEIAKQEKYPKPQPETEKPKPATTRGIKRFFRRKSF